MLPHCIPDRREGCDKKAGHCPVFFYGQDGLYVAGAWTRNRDDGQDGLYVAGAWTRNSDDGQDGLYVVGAWTRNSDDGQDGLAGFCSCKTRTSTFPGGRISRAHGRALATLVRVAGSLR